MFPVLELLVLISPLYSVGIYLVVQAWEQWHMMTATPSKLAAALYFPSFYFTFDFCCCYFFVVVAVVNKPHSWCSLFDGWAQTESIHRWLINQQLYMFVVYFDQQMHACACVRMIKNDEKHCRMMKKVPFPSCPQEAHVRRMKKNGEKSLLISDWEWLPKAGWHLNTE